MGRAMTTERRASIRPFNLQRWFSLLSLAVITAIGTTSAILLSRFLRDHLLQVDAAVTMEFVQSIVESHDAAAYLSGIGHGQDEEALNEFFGRIVHMQDVVRANAYSTDKMLVWSSTAKLIGRRFENNPELDEALAGHIATDSPSQVSGPRLRAHRGPAGMGTPFPAALGSHMITIIPEEEPDDEQANYSNVGTVRGVPDSRNARCQCRHHTRTVREAGA
jgi:hypothetical protein